MSESTAPKTEGGIQIREVWAENLDSEFGLIRQIVDDFPYVAMDTEFPGVVLRPLGPFRTSSDHNYQNLKANVDLLKMIQVGLAFTDENGNLPTCGDSAAGCVWQFNFREFDPEVDMFASDSIELLSRSGIDFKQNREKGVDVSRFGELLMSSGVVLNGDIQWVAFHSGHDFGYLLKALTGHNLPETQAGFFQLMETFFPVVFDIKHLMKYCPNLYGGLNKLAETLEVQRHGICHQAGSDSLVTAHSFIKLKEVCFAGSVDRYAGVLFGLGVDSDKDATDTAR